MTEKPFCVYTLWRFTHFNQNHMKNSLFLLLLVTLFLKPTLSVAQISPYGFPLDSLETYVLQTPEYLYEIHAKVLDPDSSLSFEEAYFLYYGSAFLEGYSPYGEQLEKELQEQLIAKEDYEGLIEYFRDVQERNPGNLRSLLKMGFAYEEVGDTAMARVYFEKYFSMLKIPYFSGSGSSMDSAWIVRSVEDEYLIVQELGYQVVGQELKHDDNGIPYDILSVRKETDTGVEKSRLYFNVYQPFVLGMQQLIKDADKKIKDKKSRKKEERKKKKEERKKKKEK